MVIFLENVNNSVRLRPTMNRIRLLRTGISLAAAMLTLLLVPEMAAPVSAANAIILLDQFAKPAIDSGSHDIDSSAGLIYAQITQRCGTIHSRPALNPTTPPAPQFASVAPTYPSIREVRNMPGIDR
jgi:hypothetical protein